MLLIFTAQPLDEVLHSCTLVWIVTSAEGIPTSHDEGVQEKALTSMTVIAGKSTPV